MKLAFPKHFAPSKTWLVLGIALVVGLLAAWAARNYLINQMAAIEARNQGRQVSLVVAKRVLKRGDIISSDTVAVRPIPIDYAHSAALLPEDFERFDGQALAYSVNAGEMILWPMLEGKKAPTFSARVEAGRRAITVPVDEINSISGLLEPGDTIDLIVTVDQKGNRISAPLLQKVQVMATGQRSVDDPRSGERRHYSTVTLDTTPEQAQNVILAREVGRITALLRNPQDSNVASADVFDARLLLSQGDAQKPEKHLIGQVPVLYGGTGGRIPSEGLHLGQYVHSETMALPPPGQPIALPPGNDARAAQP